MSALTAERDTASREGKVIVRGVEEGKKIYAGAMVARNAAGYAVPAADAAGLVVEGRAKSTVDNTGGADGALQVEIEQGIFPYDAAGLTEADNGKDCYAADDQTVDLTGGTNKVYVGVIAEVVSATEAWVKLGIGSKKTLTEAEVKALDAVVTDAIPTTPEIQALIDASLPEAAVVAAVATADAAAQGAGYVQADAQTVAALANANKTAINAILTALKAAGLMANE